MATREREQNSRLIIEVPNANDALLTVYKNKNFANFTYWSCHLYLHTENTLKDLVEKAGFQTIEIRQFQRYPLANHLYWLAEGKPGGQTILEMFNEPGLIEAYNKILVEKKQTDTLIGIFKAQ